MHDGQMYVGRGHSATTNDSTADSATQTANSTAEQSITPALRRKLFLEAQTKLLDLVDNFMQEGFASSPIETINELLYYWLTSPDTDLSRIQHQNQLDRAFSLVNFLSKAYEQTVKLQKFSEVETEVQNG